MEYRVDIIEAPAYQDAVAALTERDRRRVDRAVNMIYERVAGTGSVIGRHVTRSGRTRDRRPPAQYHVWQLSPELRLILVMAPGADAITVTLWSIERSDRLHTALQRLADRSEDLRRRT